MFHLPCQWERVMSTQSDRGVISPLREEQPIERRRADRTRDDADWESKVLGRLNGRLHQMPAPETNGEPPNLGWESSVLDVLRKRIEKTGD
jgi:hypothetical protein